MNVNAALDFKRRMRAKLAAQAAAPAAPPPLEVPAPPVPTGHAALDHQARQRHAAAVARISEARARRQEAALQEVREEQNDYEQQLRDIDADELRLRELPRGEARTAMLTGELLPKWTPVVDAYVAAGKAYPNPLAVKVMIWLFNVADLDRALPLADLLVSQDQRMPDNFKRDLPVFVADALLEILEDRQARGETIPADIEARAKAQLDTAALPDIVRIKYAKLLARLHEADNPDLAYGYYLKAADIDPRKAQVKTILRKLKKQLGK